MSKNKEIKEAVETVEPIERQKVLYVASEAVPFVKTGGLADVVGTLPKEFDRTYWDIRVVLPNYTCIAPQYRDNFSHVTDFHMDMGPMVGNKYVGVESYVYEGITFYFVDNLEYFDCYYPYSDTRWDLEKFMFFCKAALSMLPAIDFRPELIHCHDWQSGLVPVYLKTMFQSNPFYHGIKSIMTIHNLKFQGVWDIKVFAGISGLSYDLFTPDKLEFNKDANMLKGGICYADYITTVSRTYAEEIQMPYYGEGLDGLLGSRHFDMQGIVNGIDYDEYNPETDTAIYKQFGLSNFREAKKQNKMMLQEELELTVSDKKFMIGIVSRLTEQKGMDLVCYALERILDENTQMVIVGTGDPMYENTFRHFAWKYQDRLSTNIYYSEELSRKVYACCDAFLMPSRFEPCGISQMIAYRYGTVPIVRETGGLKDTVDAYNEYDNTGDGFSFTNFNGDEMLNTINYAKEIYFTKKAKWNNIVERGLKKDFSWQRSMERYVGLYNHIMGR